MSDILTIEHLDADGKDDALRLLIESADKHGLPDDYMVKVSVSFMRYLAAEITALRAFLLRDEQRWIERADVAEARVAELEARLRAIAEEADYALDEMEKRDYMDAAQALRIIRSAALSAAPPEEGKHVS